MTAETSATSSGLAATIASRVSMPRTSAPTEYAKTLAAVTPTLSPVNDPGPTETATNCTSSGRQPTCFSKASMAGAND